MRATIGSLAVLLLAATASLHAQEKETKRKQPNILFIMSDDHASAAVSAYGSFLGKYANTPNIDRIAKGGMRFKNALVTNSICTPSRAAILTGQYSHRNGVYTLNDAIDPNRIHLAHLLKALGYQTGLVGKWHLHSDPSGFDWWSILPGQGAYIKPKLRAKGDKLKEFDGYSEDVITTQSIDWLKQRDATKPFFLCCHFKAPHRPWDPAPRFKDLYKNDKIPEPPTLLDDYKNRSKAAANTTLVIGEHMSARDLGQPVPKDMTTHELRKFAYQIYMKNYLRCVAAVDENVGRLLDYLDKEGIADDTIVVYTSDQGFFLGEHGYYDKRFMYEECLTTPLVVRYPPVVPAGKVNTDMVLNIDHAPTFLDFAGGKIPQEMQGRSYRSLLEGKTPTDWRKSMYYRYYMHLADHGVPAHYGVRTERYTLINFYGQPLGMKGAVNKPTEPEWELFDRQQDPQQMRNVVSDPMYAQAVRELKAELEKLRRELGDDKNP
jgi:arylsulfatase A-like enzyme